MANLIKFNKESLIKDLKELHKQLMDIYLKLFVEKYINEKIFKEFIDKEYKKDRVMEKDKEEWNEKFCNKASYILINKILFIKICEDKKIMISNKEESILFSSKVPKTNDDNKLYNIDYKRFMYFIKKYTFNELFHLAFGSGDHSYQNAVNSNQDIYEKIIPETNEINESILISGGINKNTYVYVFRDLIKNIIEKLNKPEYYFGQDIKGNILGDVYEKFLDKDARKVLGQFYTPGYIIDYILKNTIGKTNIIENPFIKVLDPSCGSGHFLIAAYDMLRKMFLENLFLLREKYKEEKYEILKDKSKEKISGQEYWVEENINYHLLKHCIYGADIDDFAVQLTTVNLLFKDLSHIPDSLNIIQCDSLIKWEEDYETKDKCEFWSQQYDYIIGNPPYVGHKQLSLDYKKWLLKNYGEVFKDKSDLSYCFFKRNLENIKEKGMVAIITSRYFMESPTGKGLRKYLKEKAEITNIIDFYGAEIFKAVGVATAIYFYGKKKDNINEYKLKDDISIYKLKDNNFDFEHSTDIYDYLDSEVFEHFNINQDILENERWILIPKIKYNIFKKIENTCKCQLHEIVDSFQGIITGCDKAFVLEGDKAEELKIEANLLKPWIKNSNVSRYFVKSSNLKIIYSNLINEEDKYVNSVKHILRFKERLEGRRECKNGIRKWYELQWGRNLNSFEKSKIVYPYKAKSNKFAIDENNYLCSADVYSFTVKDEYIEKYPLEYLLGILNSKTYEFYFKVFAKKMGNSIYDYYPNSVLSLKIPEYKLGEEISEKTKQIMKLSIEMQNVEIHNRLLKEGTLNDENKVMKSSSEIKSKICNLEIEIDRILQTIFNLSSEEIMLINKEIFCI